MITRIVVLTFEENKVQEFLSLFDEHARQIRNYPGCMELVLCKDTRIANRFYTYSVWNSEQDLENYRQSDFFRQLWSKIKGLLKEKPLAFSLQVYKQIP
ncbi:MAG: putative quinol monooxygenase [Bacteroidia bacterium]|nr:putative quinol monooxygenase [Bacteroidia bacterium]